MAHGLIALARQIRGMYRQLRAESQLLYSNSRFPSINEASRRELQSVLRARINTVDTPVGVILFLPINNWEVDLKSAFESLAVVDMFQIPAVPFFLSAEEWAEYFLNVNRQAVRFFEATYDPSRTNIVFCYASDFNLSVDTVKTFKRPNTVVINFNWDDILWFHGRCRGQPIGVRSIAPHFDLSLSFSPRALAQYRRVGARAIFWDSEEDGNTPCRAFNPTIARALFVGSCYGRRRELVARIRKAGLPIDVFGSGWGTEYLPQEELPRYFAKYAVTVGLGTLADTWSLCGIKGRDFEVPLSGGLYLTNEHAELSRCYEIGKEILTFKTFEQCTHIIRDILDNPGRYTPIRCAGYKKAMEKHQWRSRVKFLLNLVMANEPTHTKGDRSL